MHAYARISMHMHAYAYNNDMVTPSFRNSYSTLKTIHKNKYPTASMHSIELHGVRLNEKQLKILIHTAKLRVQTENRVFYSMHRHEMSLLRSKIKGFDKQLSMHKHEMSLLPSKIKGFDKQLSMQIYKMSLLRSKSKGFH